MAQYLYRIQPVWPEMLSKGSTELRTGLSRSTSRHLKELMAKGVLILAGRTLNQDDSSFGTVVFNAGSEDELGE